MGTVNIFVGNNLIIDFDIFTFWIEGFSVEESKEITLKRDPSLREIKESIILQNIHDNYHIFGRLEQYLAEPPRLNEQLMFQISDEICEKLIEKYYGYDVIIMRELLCHKLTQRQRKDLDDISEKLGYRYRVKSCRRQFDNLKRIIRTIEEMKGPIIKNITENFCLPSNMAEHYSAFVFIARNQFEISKRKLSHLSLDDFIYCANMMMKNWSSNSHDSDSDMNRDFLIDLKDLKIFTERDILDDHKKLVSMSMTKQLATPYSSDNRRAHKIDQNFKDLSKGLIEIAYALNHSKDMRDLFVDLIELFIEPCRENDLSKNEVKIFLEEYRNRAHLLHDICRENPKCLSVFDRYITTISNCILKMYHS